MKALLTLMLGILVLAAISGVVSASGVNSLNCWLPDRSVQLSPGESKDIQMTYTNSGSDSAETIRIKVENGSDIAVITDPTTADNYVPVNGSLTVHIRVTAPADAPVGYLGDIGISFTPVSVQGQRGQQLSIGSAFERHCNVVVQAPSPTEEQQQGSGMLPVWLVFAILIVAVIIFIVIKRRPRKKGK